MAEPYYGDEVSYVTTKDDIWDAMAKILIRLVELNGE